MYQEFIERYNIKGHSIQVIRGDKMYNSPLPHHLKMGALEKIVIDARASGRHTIGAFCTKHGIWPFGLPHLAERHGLNSIVCFPAKKMDKVPVPLRGNNSFGYQMKHEIKLLKPNMVNVNQSQAKRYIMEENDGFYVPFGCDLPNAVETLSYQLKFPVDKIGTLIVPTGSGVTLAGVLMALKRYNTKVERVEAVMAHYPRTDDVIKTIWKYTPVIDAVHFTHNYKYDEIPEIECPWPAHPYYELKAYEWLTMSVNRLPSPIFFLNIGAPS